MKSNEKNLDTTSHRDPTAILGVETAQSIWLLYTTSLGLLWDIRLPRLPRPRTQKARVGMGIGSDGIDLQPNLSSTSKQRVVVNH